MWQYLPAGPTISARLNHSWPVIRLVVFLISGQGYFTFLYRYAKHNREGGRKKTQTNRSKRKREKFVTLLCSSPCIYRLSRACILRETSTKPLGMLNHLLTDLFCRLVSAAPFCWLCASLDWPLLPTVSGTFLPSSSGLVGDLARKPFVWVSRQNRQRDSLTGTHTHWNGCHP